MQKSTQQFMISIHTRLCDTSQKKILLKAIFIFIVLSLALLVVDPDKIIELRSKPEKDKEVDTLEESGEDLPETGGDREIRRVPSIQTGESYNLETIPVEENLPVFGVSIDADITLPEAGSYVRVILTDTKGRDYLVREDYLLLSGSREFSVADSCEETCLLDGIFMDSLKVESELGGKINIKNINKDTVEISEVTEEEKIVQKEAVLDQKVAKLQEEIDKNKLGWQAGKTDFARLSFEQRQNMFGGKLPNFQGLEFYKGGVYRTLAESEIDKTYAPLSFDTGISRAFIQKKQLIATSYKTDFESNILGVSDEEVKAAMVSSSYISSWDWRTKHGANNPSSYYFDQNPDSNETGNGWITGVRNQANCGSCWAFAATGATEALVNLYYNQHVDLNLSEQDALSCSGAGSCSGGWPSVTLDYYTTTGVVDEACFPYSASDESCTNKCGNPNELVQIGGRIPFTNKTEDNLKSMIVEYGPMSGGVYSWSHAMTLVGWRTNGSGETEWIFKNSWGKSWGENGYLYLVTNISNIGWTHALLSPITDLSSRTINCVDADGDGYYNWGISVEKPITCPQGIPDDNDCNDSDPNVFVYDESYECVAIPSDIFFNYSDSNFDPVPVGQGSDSREVIIGNRGGGDLTINSIALLDESNFNLDLNPPSRETTCGQPPFILEPNATCSLDIQFTPQGEDDFATNIVVESNDPVKPMSDIVFQGEGTYDPDVVCEYFDGFYSSSANSCFGINDQICEDYRGEVDLCISYCVPGVYCTQQCIQGCRF